MAHWARGKKGWAELLNKRRPRPTANNELRGHNDGQRPTCSVNCIAFAVSKPSFIPSPFSVGLLLRSRDLYAVIIPEVIRMSVMFTVWSLASRYLVRNRDDLRHKIRNGKNCLIEKSESFIDWRICEWRFEIFFFFWEEIIYGVIWYDYCKCKFFSFLSC